MMPSTIFAVAILAAFSAMTPHSAGAQHPGADSAELAAQWSAARSCVASIPPNAIHLTTVHLVGTAASGGDTLAPALRGSVDKLVEAMARHARVRLGAAPGALAPTAPASEHQLSRSRYGGQITVIAWRDGQVRWRAGFDSSGIWHGDTLERDGELFLGAVLDSVTRAGEGFPWPANLGFLDSVAFDIEYRIQLPKKNGAIPALKDRHAVPLGQIHVPWEEEVRHRRGPVPRYPEFARRAGVTGRFTSRYVVDTAGRVLPHTIHGIRPIGRTARSGTTAPFEDDFVSAIRESVRRSTYHPLRRGGCALPQLVQQPFFFDMEW